MTGTPPGDHWLTVTLGWWQGLGHSQTTSDHPDPSVPVPPWSASTELLLRTIAPLCDDLPAQGPWVQTRHSRCSQCSVHPSRDAFIIFMHTSSRCAKQPPCLCQGAALRILELLCLLKESKDGDLHPSRDDSLQPVDDRWEKDVNTPASPSPHQDHSEIPGRTWRGCKSHLATSLPGP